MELHNLTPAKGSVKNHKKRLGRGQGSGKGGTSARGHKGAQSRSGYSSKRNFEGGQMPLQRRVPKFGFKNPFRIEYTGVNLDVLQRLADTHKISEVNPIILNQHGIVSKNDRVKILGRGELKATLKVEAHAFSATAKTAIETAGGSTNVTK